jgi:hypothetical protein
VYLICGFFAFLYGVCSLLTLRVELAYVGAICVVLALSSKLCVTPARRKLHVQLSAEQLELLRRDHLKDVQDRFRKIIVGWRSKSERPHDHEEVPVPLNTQG